MPSRLVVGRGISRPKMPRGGALLRKPGLGLKFPGTVRDAFISPTLSLHQVLGSSSLEQAGSLKTDGACVRMGSYVLDHGWSMRRLRGAISVLSECGRDRSGTPNQGRSADVLVPSAWPTGRLWRRFLALLARNRKEHLALSLDALMPLLRGSGRGVFLGNAAAQCLREVHKVLWPWNGSVT